MRQEATAHLPLLVTEKEAGKILGFSIRTLQKWRIEGRGPRYVQVSARAVRYRRDDLESWITERLRTSTSDATVREEAQWRAPRSKAQGR